MRRYHSIESENKRNKRKKFFEGMKYLLRKKPNNWGSIHPLSCGRSKCTICHYDKVFKFKTQKQLLADISYEEQLADFFNLERE